MMVDVVYVVEVAASGFHWKVEGRKTKEVNPRLFHPPHHATPPPKSKKATGSRHFIG